MNLLGKENLLLAFQILWFILQNPISELCLSICHLVQLHINIIDTNWPMFMKLVNIMPLDTSPSWYFLTFCDQKYLYNHYLNLWGGNNISATEQRVWILVFNFHYNVFLRKQWLHKLSWCKHGNWLINATQICMVTCYTDLY